jgi:hypothetical protein
MTSLSSAPLISDSKGQLLGKCHRAKKAAMRGCAFAKADSMIDGKTILILFSKQRELRNVFFNLKRNV